MEQHAENFAISLHISPVCHVCMILLASRIPDQPLSALKVLMKKVFFMLDLHHPFCFVASNSVGFFVCFFSLEQVYHKTFGRTGSSV